MKRTRKVLERWPPDSGTNSRVSNQRKSVKRLGGSTPGKDLKGREGQRYKQKTSLWEWLIVTKKGLGPRKASEDELKRFELVEWVRERPQGSDSFPGDIGQGPKSDSM